MNKFSLKSQERLNECHPLLQKLFLEVVKHYDCTVICGHRTKEDQDQAFRSGMSKVQWPDSKHNKRPSLAVDIVPYPVDWQDKTRFYHFIGFVMGMAATMGIKLRSGADWDGDFDLKDQNFFDLPHFELAEEKSDADAK